MMQKNNYCVIMAGGVGSRFWPFSRENKPKQFLDFFGTGKSLLEMTIDRFRPLVPIENVLIVTNRQYKSLIQDILPELGEDQILCEPARRNTAPCIAYAMAHIAAKTKGEDARIVVAPSDHLILQEQKFQQVIAEGLNFVAENDALLTLGMRPTRPETGYGYIQMGKEWQAGCGIHQVSRFTEKPELETAKAFVASGDFLWNSGIFLWNLQSIQCAMSQYLGDVVRVFEAGRDQMGTANEQAFIDQAFPSCPSISIDYGVMEKAQNVYVMPASFGWSDLGTWGSLYELSEKDAQANVSLHSQAMFYESHGNIVTLEKGKLAVIEGLEDMIVAEQGNVLLICRKAHEQQIKQMVQDADQRFEGRFK